MTIHLTDEAVRVCSDCVEILPLTHFRRRYRDRPHRMRVCNGCHAARERHRLARRRKQKKGVDIQKFATAFCATRDQKQRQLICRLGIQAAGGFSQFLRNWHGVISSMVSERRHTPRLLKLYELLFELQREQNELHRQALADVSADDLEAVVRTQVTEMIKENPKLAVDAAERLGWRLIRDDVVKAGASDSA